MRHRFYAPGAGPSAGTVRLPDDEAHHLSRVLRLKAADAVSVFVRQSLVQLLTPDAMRGRVTAVSSLFISASNELGEFESGVAARILGPIGAAIFGGVGSVALTGLWAYMSPSLRVAHLCVERSKEPSA